jgi:hypothetical protein
MLLTSGFQLNSQDPIAHWPDMLAQNALRIKPYAKSEIEGSKNQHENG